jgi:hypothetical protein
MGYVVNVRGRDDDPILSLTPPGRSIRGDCQIISGRDIVYNGIVEKIKVNERVPTLPEEKPSQFIFAEVLKIS